MAIPVTVAKARIAKHAVSVSKAQSHHQSIRASDITLAP